MKKVFAILLAVSMTLSLAACGAQAPTPTETPAATPAPTQPSEMSYTPGSYTVTAQGHNGDFDVTVTFDAKSIVDIAIGENNESRYLSTTTMDRVKNEILADQTVNVDTISGATVSTGALRAAVTSAVKEAGVDSSALPAAPAEISAHSDVTTQVVIIGSGSAGLAAAAEATGQGLDVILVEQLGLLGGSSVRTGYYVGGGTVVQKAAGTDGDYSKEAFITNFLDNSATGTGGGDRSEIDNSLYNESLATRIANMASDNIDWLYGLGLQMVPIGFLHYGSDGAGYGRIGSYMAYAYTKYLDDNKVDYRLNTRADKLLVKDGAVTGVSVEAQDGTYYNINADAVILATGGYNANQDLIAKYNPQYAGYSSDVCKGADGSGLLMAESVGATLIAMDQANYHSFALMWRGASRSLSSIMTTGAIAVNAEGKRFVNEDTYYDKSAADAITEQTGGVCYVILNQAIIDTVCVPGDTHLANVKDMYVKADTIEELAKALGVDAVELGKTLSSYSQYVESGVDTEFGRSAQYLTASFDEGPYYGVKAQPELHTVHGGIVIDDDTHVLDANGSPIAGLYAAGECSASPILGSNTNTVSLAEGRIAAQTIADGLAD